METLNIDTAPDFAHEVIEVIKAEYGLECLSGKYTEFIVGTDDQAEEAHDDYLQDYLDEIILPTINENYRYYFDAEKWLADEKGNRADALATYDGKELTAEVDGETIYIYRKN